MNKKYILKLEQYTISRIIKFGEKYKNENIIDLYSEDELLSKEFPIEIIDDVYSSPEFSCALWEYMALDLFIHPINHILYQYIKKNNYNDFINEIEKSRVYSNDNVEIYNLNNLFESKEIKVKHFTALLNIIKSEDNKFVEEIIRINMM
jgi:hypothetical protein